MIQGPGEKRCSCASIWTLTGITWRTMDQLSQMLVVGKAMEILKWDTRKKPALIFSGEMASLVDKGRCLDTTHFYSIHPTF